MGLHKKHCHLVEEGEASDGPEHDPVNRGEWSQYHRILGLDMPSPTPALKLFLSSTILHLSLEKES